MRKKFSFRKTNNILKVILALIGLVIIILFLKIAFPSKLDTTSISIILAPQHEDAVLSLGGMIAQKDRPTLVASFFTPSSEGSKMADNEATKAAAHLGAKSQYFAYTSLSVGSQQDQQSLQAEIAKDIQSLIIGNADKTVYIYAPSIFNKEVNNPEHMIIHNAFVSVATSFPNQNVHFYFYEDYPYTSAFNNTSVISLKKNLENETGLLIETTQVMLSSSEVAKKISALKEYSTVNEYDVNAIKTSTEKRCGTNKSCEVIYQLKQF